MDKIDGDPDAMAAAAQQLVAPARPASLARAGAPLGPVGLIEGLGCGIVDALASIAAADFVTRCTDDILTNAAKVHHISLEYSWADMKTAAEMVGASTKVATAGLGLLKTVTGAGAATPEVPEVAERAESTTTPETAGPAADVLA